MTFDECAMCVPVCEFEDNTLIIIFKLCVCTCRIKNTTFGTHTFMHVCVCVCVYMTYITTKILQPPPPLEYKYFELWKETQIIYFQIFEQSNYPPLDPPPTHPTAPS